MCVYRPYLLVHCRVMFKVIFIYGLKRLGAVICEVLFKLKSVQILTNRNSWSVLNRHEWRSSTAPAIDVRRNRHYRLGLTPLSSVLRNYSSISVVCVNHSLTYYYGLYQPRVNEVVEIVCSL